jgi:hypothetical protein
MFTDNTMAMTHLKTDVLQFVNIWPAQSGRHIMFCRPIKLCLFNFYALFILSWQRTENTFFEGRMWPALQMLVSPILSYDPVYIGWSQHAGTAFICYISNDKDNQLYLCAHCSSVATVHLKYRSADKSLARPGRKRLTGHLQPTRNWPTW